LGEKATLVKFGAKHHIRQLQVEGLLYMSNLPYFWQVEDEELRGDPNDGVVAIQRGEGGHAKTVEADPIRFQITRWTIRELPEHPEAINAFCMYAYRPHVASPTIDERNLRFGDTALVFINPQAFVDRVAAHLEREGVLGRADLVEYVPDDYAGAVGPFRKLETFSYQSEWRLVCERGPGGPRQIMIGGLSDISTAMPSSEVGRRVRVGENGRLIVDL